MVRSVRCLLHVKIKGKRIIWNWVNIYWGSLSAAGVFWRHDLTRNQHDDGNQRQQHQQYETQQCILYSTCYQLKHAVRGSLHQCRAAGLVYGRPEESRKKKNSVQGEMSWVHRRRALSGGRHAYLPFILANVHKPFLPSSSSFTFSPTSSCACLLSEEARLLHKVAFPFFFESNKRGTDSAHEIFENSGWHELWAWSFRYESGWGEGTELAKGTTTSARIDGGYRAHWHCSWMELVCLVWFPPAIVRNINNILNRCQGKYREISNRVYNGFFVTEI